MIVFFFLFSLLLLFLYFNLLERVRYLEKQVSAERKTEAQPDPLRGIKPDSTHPPAAPAVPSVKKDPPPSYDPFTEWLKEDWLLKLGACLVLLGFGWLATHAYLNDWIGPMGWITLFILGTLLISTAFWRKERVFSDL